MSKNSKKVIFNAKDVAARFEAGLKEAQAAGKEDTAWWRQQGILRIEWESTRAAGNNTRWGNVVYTDKAGVSGPLNLRINGERNCGMIMPSTDEGVKAMIAANKNAKRPIEKRVEKKPVLQIQKYTVPVKTEADECTLLTDAAGQPILPPDDKRSDYFLVAYHVSAAFVFEAKERLERGAALVAKAKAMAKEKATPAAVLEAFAAANGPRFPGDMILSGDQATDLQKLYAKGDALLAGATIAGNTKVAALVQESISRDSKKNAGKPLPNPITRVGLEFEKQTGVAKMAFFDKSQPYRDGDGKIKFEAAKVDGEPISDANIHAFIRSNTIVDGIVGLDGFCFSGMGISVPAKADVLIASKATQEAIDQDDVYGDGYDMGDVGEIKARAVADAAPKSGGTPASTPSKAASSNGHAPATTPPTEEDYSSLLNELGATSSATP